MEVTEDESKEKWRPIKEYEGRYEVSNFGRIKSVERIIVYPSGKKQPHKEKIMSIIPRKALRGRTSYYCIRLCKSGKYKGFLVHRLVAEAFIPNPENKPEINHIDGNGLNNQINNLEWATSSENKRHCIKNLGNHQLSPVVCVETGERFNSLTEAGRRNGTTGKNIWNATKYGVRANGLHYKKINLKEQ